MCTLFDSDDVNFEFISTPGQLYYVYVGAQDTDGNPATDDNGAFDIEFTCDCGGRLLGSNRLQLQR